MMGVFSLLPRRVLQMGQTGGKMRFNNHGKMAESPT
jgi:hypothetical protein